MARVFLKKIGAGGEPAQISVEDRELLVLTGPRDGGHIQLLRAIAGLEESHGWEMSVGERSINDLPAADREVATVFGADAFYPHLGVDENLAFALRMKGAPKAETERRVAEAAKLLGLQSRQQSAATMLDRFRVVLGRALATQPKAVLFHEPLANLDAAARLQLRSELAQLRLRLQLPMIWATDEAEEAMAIADRVAVFRGGRLEQVASPGTIYREPANRFVAQFFGSPSMNFIAGKLKEVSGGLLFKETGQGSMECKLPALSAAMPYSGKDVVLGLRPEDIDLVKEASQPEGCRFQAVVELVEFSGAETKFHLQTGAHRLVGRAKVPADHGEEGRRLRFEFDPARAHLFDPVTNNRII